MVFYDMYGASALKNRNILTKFLIILDFAYNICYTVAN